MITKLRQKLLKNKIAYRFTLYVIALSFTMVLLANFVQLYIEHQRVIERKLVPIQKAYLPALAEYAYQEDKKHLDITLSRLLELLDTKYVAIYKDGKILSEKGDASLHAHTHPVPLYYRTTTGIEQVGILYIGVNWKMVYAHNLITNAIAISLVALFVLITFHLMIARHLNKITHYVEHLDSENFDHALKLDRPSGHPDGIDELERVVTAINTMRINLQRSYKGVYENEQDAKILLKSSLIGLALWNLDGRFMIVNPAYARIIGRTADEVLRLNYWQVVVEKDLVSAQIELRSLKPDEHYGPFEKEYLHKDGYFVPVRISTVIIEKNGEKYAWSNVENITEQKRVADELYQARRKAEIANLTKNQFLANMSHELRTPLNAIIGYSEILSEELEYSEQPRLLQDAKSIHVAGKHLLGLINDILDLSKIEAGKMDTYIERLELSPIIENVVTSIQPLIDNKANVLTLKCDEDLGYINTDLSKFRQILFNLLSNASKFCERGKITLEVRRISKKEGDWIAISISDDGIGMTSEQQANLFRMFSQVNDLSNKRHSRTGLGLALTKNFVLMLGGTFQVESEFGKGSHFIVQLPTYLEISQLPDTTLTRPILYSPEEGGVVLVIDDDQSTRDLLKNYLSKVGYQVALASNGGEGLKMAKKLRPNAITLDVMMPVVDGWEVLSQLKTDPELAHIPVIMMTMLDDKDIGYSLGAAEYLSKPVSRDQLLSVLRKYQVNNIICTVMVVEDDNATREMIGRNLKKMGWKVLGAENGRLALRLLDRNKVDLIITDLMMPEMNGFEFIDYLRQNPSSASIPIIVLTAKDISAEERLWLKKSTNTIFQKGAYNRDELLSNLRSLLAKTVSKVASE